MYKEKLGINNLENILEEMVFKELYLIIQDSHIKVCKCNTCVQDIAAIVLNTMTPMYENSEKYLPNEEKKDEYTKIVENVRKSLKSAVEKVIEAPHHHSMQIV